MTPAEQLQAAKEALATWEAEKAARGLHPRVAPTLEWTRAWLEARNKVAELRWTVDQPIDVLAEGEAP